MKTGQLLDIAASLTPTLQLVTFTRVPLRARRLTTRSLFTYIVSKPRPQFIVTTRSTTNRVTRKCTTLSSCSIWQTSQTLNVTDGVVLTSVTSVRSLLTSMDTATIICLLSCVTMQGTSTIFTTKTCNLRVGKSSQSVVVNPPQSGSRKRTVGSHRVLCVKRASPIRSYLRLRFGLCFDFENLRLL